MNETAEIFKALNRYDVISDYTAKNTTHRINREAFDFLNDNALPENSFQENFNLLTNSSSSLLNSANDLELFYAVWRKRLIEIKQDSELPEIMDYGLNHLFKEGYTDLSGDIFPFISMLMDEHKKYHYDHSRTKAFGEGARGVYTSTEILNTFKYPDRTVVAGVCRDVHDVGLRMIRELSTDYYAHFYPEMDIHIDDYIFLTSWVTQSSQHITISYIDPLNPKTIYELDWGRLIKKTDNYGYEHGRNYGNVFRVWQFDKETDINGPIDYKKTMIGNIFDEQIFNSDEADAFWGIKNVEPFSATALKHSFAKQADWQMSFGRMSLEQGFFTAGITHRSKELSLGKYISFRGAVSLQAMLLEESRKKNVMFPIHNYESSHAGFGFPRYIASFKLFEMQLSDKILSHFYLHNSIEVFLVANRSVSDTDEESHKINTTGDGGIYSTQGYSISFRDKNFSSELKLQNRSFLIPNDVRLMSPNPFELLKNAQLVSPARDIILNIKYSYSRGFNIETKSVIEFTNMDNILFYGDINVGKTIKGFGNLHFSASSRKNLKGFHYFWYPVDRNLFHIGVSDANQRIKVVFSLQEADSEFTKGINIQYRF